MELKTKLLIIPCSQAKHGTGQTIKLHSITDFIGMESATLLRQSRDEAFQRRHFDRLALPTLSGFVSGTMYLVEGLRDEIKHAIERGMHVLVESGGYGLIRAEEPIHKYGAQMNRTAPVWRRVLPAVLDDYVRRNQIDEAFIAGSKQYASLLRRPQCWNRAKCHWFIAYAGRENGNPCEIVPREIGVTVRDLLRTDCRPGVKWSSN
ncbi:MAG TPA: hypothetical protein VG204_23485 [Terriglobia bacterium]|nr:hypothetical protein [Terriglobia bacterium]